MKPANVFDRDAEWYELTRFVGDTQPHATLGIVSGRRRQGKTFLLDALVRATNGFMFTATESTEADSLNQLGQALAVYQQEPTPYRFADWSEAITRLFSIARGHPIPVVIDEFPYLVKASPQLPSLIQRAFDPAAQRNNTPIRLLLCGSALSFMGKLLSGNAPLRGRSSLEMIIPTLDYQLASQFWGITDWHTAVLVNAIVGGTPAYRREFVADDSPADAADFNDWVTRSVLNPNRPLFREARYLLSEEPDMRDTGLYHAVLSAITAGNSSRGGIANYLQRKATDLAHPLSVLQDAGLITHEEDAFRRNRSSYRIAEPLLTFYHAIMRPEWGNLERAGRATEVWQRSQHAFDSLVVGPHFEELCRQWARHADPSYFQDRVPSQVLSGTVSDPGTQATHQLDVTVFGNNTSGQRQLLAIGESKWQEPIGLGHLTRLQHIRDLLVRRGEPGAQSAGLFLFGSSKFSDELSRRAIDDPSIHLIGLDDLYRPSA